MTLRHCETKRDVTLSAQSPKHEDSACLDSTLRCHVPVAACHELTTTIATLSTGVLLTNEPNRQQNQTAMTSHFHLLT